MDFLYRASARRSVLRVALCILFFLVCVHSWLGCQLGPGTCIQHQDCAQKQQACIQGLCKACTFNECGALYACVKGKCLPYECWINADCPDTEVCHQNICHPFVPSDSENTVREPSQTTESTSPDASDSGVLPEPNAIEDRLDHRSREQTVIVQCTQMASTCSQDSDCGGGVCTHPFGLGSKICVQPCSHNDDCCSGFLCRKRDATGPHWCLPACSVHADCTSSYQHMPFCQENSYCWEKIRPGYLCREDKDCSSFAPHCRSVTGQSGASICTRICTKDSDCVGGKGCKKRAPNDSHGMCFPSCTHDSDCVRYTIINHCIQGICSKR